MAAPRRIDADDDRSSEVPRRRNWLLGLAPAPGPTPKGVPDAATLAEENEALRARLADAERRAREAERALPHLLGLGQSTVNGLLDDARARGRDIIEAARRQAEQELGAQRDEVRRETRELDALRMAVAAEAMGLEEIRAELHRRVSMSAVELARVAQHPMLLGGEPLRVEQSGLDTVSVAAIASSSQPVAAPFDQDEVAEVDDDDAAAASVPVVTVTGGETVVVLPSAAGIGIVEASTMPSDAVAAQLAIADAMETTAVEAGGAAASAPAVADDEVAAEGVAVADEDAPARPNPSPGFADAWALDEDDEVAEAFDRFFSADIDAEPSREWILADDTKP
ncbi:ATP synthase subunit B family protein [Actinomarinicola tropica]|uniref:Uncharacterized protein n=1 Tax=Actinomarinicola tropica TaxID=2789776 RepID=A0A5Q2RNY8_9ACTN|nr:hypothetical protein [Actinomarinicola tropica]QGG96662.1 hypothetical protein GH723_17020 [Actinomarinicola tropica]